jgi:hypothetical protein
MDDEAGVPVSPAPWMDMGNTAPRRTAPRERKGIGNNFINANLSK